MTLRKNHYLPKVGPKVDEGNWILVAMFDFGRRARCRRRDWAAATPMLEDVDCLGCLKRLTPEERRLRKRLIDFRKQPSASRKIAVTVAQAALQAG